MTFTTKGGRAVDLGTMGCPSLTAEWMVRELFTNNRSPGGCEGPLSLTLTLTLTLHTCVDVDVLSHPSHVSRSWDILSASPTPSAP